MARNTALGCLTWLAVSLGCLLGPVVHASGTGLLVGRVSRVLDGDSLRLQQGQHTVEVRLAAVDAPELDQPHGRAAQQALQACALGRIVTLRVSNHDRHGRTVGVLEGAGRDCGKLQLQKGLAWHADAFDRELLAAERLAYGRAQREARRARIGLWADARPLPPWEHRRRAQATARP